MRITNSQKNELHQIFIKHQLNLLDFEVTGEYEIFKVPFKNGPFYFLVTKKFDDIYVLKMSSIIDVTPNENFQNWDNVPNIFDWWARSLSNEFNTATGWESFESSNFLNTTYKDLSQNFSSEEKEQTKQSLFELQSRINKLNLANENLTTINTKLDSLLLKVDELNKFDWKSLFIGTIANLIMTLVIPPEAAGFVWQYIKTSFNGLKIKA